MARPRYRGALLPAALLLPLLLSTRPATADELELSWGGRLQSDVRFRVIGKEVGDYYNRTALPTGVARNENIFKLKLDAVYGNFAAITEIDFVWFGYTQDLDGLSDLTRREKLDPVRLEPHAAYIEAINFGLQGLDLRVGYQQVFWGKGDQFNPTNTINPNDVEDPLLFGEQVANLMVRADYNFYGDWTFSGVLVPLFKPALLPDSAILGTATTDKIPYADAPLRWRMHADAALAAASGRPVVVSAVVPHLPEASFENMQFAFRLGGLVADQDISFSYYYGRTDVPQPFLNIASERQLAEPLCHPSDGTKCVSWLSPTEVHLAYPRMQVVGLNMAGELDLFSWLTDKILPIGYRLEVALIFPQEVNLAVYNEQMLLQKAGEYPYDDYRTEDGKRPVAVKDTPFLKWVLGLDYTFSENVYMNVQWVHGFADEFGAGDFITEGWKVQKGSGIDDAAELMQCRVQENAERCASEILRPRLGDYLVLGVDVKLLSQRLLLRLFTIWDLNGVWEESWDEDAPAEGGGSGARVRTHHGMFTAEGFSAVIFPEINFNFGKGFELGGGALFMLGKDHTRFGDPANGGSQVWLRARYTY